MKMSTNPIVLLFFYGHLWCSPFSAEIKGSSTSSLPATFQTPTTVRTDPTTEPFRYSSPSSKPRDPAKNEGPPVSTATPMEKTHNEHLIGAVLVGIILMAMIVVVVSLFLWKRLRRRGSGDPHWAGRSPFADGDVLEMTTDKEPVQSSERTSVLSLLPWKFNKSTLLLGNAEGQPSERVQSLDDPSAGGADKRDSQPSPTETGNSASSSTSLQTPIPDSPGSLADAALQPEVLWPEPADLSPPPSSMGAINKGLCPNGAGALPLQSPGATPPLVPPDFSCESPGEASLLPPPPEEFF